MIVCGDISDVTVQYCNCRQLSEEVKTVNFSNHFALILHPLNLTTSCYGDYLEILILSLFPFSQRNHFSPKFLSSYSIAERLCECTGAVIKCYKVRKGKSE